jgi:hypothetical protein
LQAALPQAGYSQLAGYSPLRNIHIKQLHWHRSCCNIGSQLYVAVEILGDLQAKEWLCLLVVQVVWVNQCSKSMRAAAASATTAVLLCVE